MFYNNKHRSACGAQYDRRARYYPNNVTVPRIGVASHKLANDLYPLFLAGVCRVVFGVFFLVIITVVVIIRSRVILAGNSGFKPLEQL